MMTMRPLYYIHHDFFLNSLSAGLFSKCRLCSRANRISDLAKEHKHHSIDVAEANLMFGVCEIATELFTNVAKGVVKVHNLALMNMELSVFIFRQTENLDLHRFNLGLG